MGTKIAPLYVKIIMGDLQETLLQYCDKKPLALWRYIDDILMLWQDGEKELEAFVECLNFCHSTVKLTDSYLQKVTKFLDV